jgi:hypothetical protein
MNALNAENSEKNVKHYRLGRFWSRGDQQKNADFPAGYAPHRTRVLWQAACQKPGLFANIAPPVFP